MSALALILADRGHLISGSDQQINPSIRQLIEKGVKFFKGQRDSNIHQLCKTYEISPLIIKSSAIPLNNPELKAAENLRLEIWHRSDLLAKLIKEQTSIAVGGSHGKTTTSTFISTLLEKANQGPTAAIGGYVPCFGSNSHVGNGEILVAEADESDGTLVKFQANCSVITNLELDHTDHYPNLNELIKTMQKFAEGSKSLLANYDCRILRDNFKASAWWSINNIEDVDFAAIPIALYGDQTIADFYEKGKLISRIQIPVPGLHNLSNALGAISACRLQNIPFKEIKKHLGELQTPGRRFEFRGNWNGRQIVDDYAHHPSEVLATISMAKIMIKSKKTIFDNPPERLVVVFQPHRYSRMKEFIQEFASVLSKVDCLFLAPVYSAGEKPINNANSQALKQAINKLNPNVPIFLGKNLETLTTSIKKYSRNNDLILVIGAGDINNIWNHLNEKNDLEEWCSTMAA